MHDCVEQALFQKYVEGNLLVDALEAEREFVMTPKMFMHNINRICLSNVSPIPISLLSLVIKSGQLRIYIYTYC